MCVFLTTLAWTNERERTRNKVIGGWGGGGGVQNCNKSKDKRDNKCKGNRKRKMCKLFCIIVAVFVFLAIVMSVISYSNDSVQNPVYDANDCMSHIVLR